MLKNDVNVCTSAIFQSFAQRSEITLPKKVDLIFQASAAFHEKSKKNFNKLQGRLH
jgi:hypothetical protein